MPEPVFTYWEGRAMPYINQVCVSSVHRLFRTRHRHLDPKELAALGIEIPRHIRRAPSRFVKYDYIRAALLHQFGGWWFDCDILLFKNPTPEVEGVNGKIWKAYPLPPTPCSSFGFERVGGKWLPLLEVGVLNARRPRSEWFRRVLEKCQRKQKPSYREAVADLISQAAYEVNADGKEPVALGTSSAFYRSTEYWWDWVGLSCFNPQDPHQYGLSLYTYSIRQGGCFGIKDPYRLSKRIRGLKGPSEVLRDFPDSVLALYLQQYC